MTNDKAQVHFTIDRNAKELAKDKLDHGELSSELRETVTRIAFGEEISKRERAHKRLAELRDKKDDLRNEKRSIEGELEEVEGEIKRLEGRLDKMERREDKYEATLEMLEETLKAGGRLFEDHGQVMKAAKIGGTETEHVINELKERNPSIPDHAFVSGIHTAKEWDGVEETSYPQG